MSAMAKHDQEISADGWVGNPDMIVENTESVEAAPKQKRFHSLSLTRRIFFCSLIALTVLLLGVVLVMQSQNRAVDLLRDGLKTSSSTLKMDLEKHIQSQDTIELALANIEIDLPNKEFYNFAVYDVLGNRLRVNRPSEEAITTSQTGSILDLNFLSVTPKDMGSVFDQTLAEIKDGNDGILTFRVGEMRTVLATGRKLTTGNETVAYAVMASAPNVVSELNDVNIRGVLSFLGVALVIALFLATITARSITVPLNDLARAAEIGKSANISASEAERLLIPDLAGRNDVVGRLAKAMRDMTQGLYTRIETNESFAADVAHEIKNPLASMQSAVDTLRLTKDKKSRDDLLDILSKDVIRLDRLVSDISNASRLDSELVSEEMQEFEFNKMLENIVEFLRMEAAEKKIEVFYEPPAKPIHYSGLEERLAQVFVNLITNAISFTEKGDAIRVWTRLRDNKILAVVEDTGPGIPEHALDSIFRRFYSQRDEQEFGSHSGLGLSISKQIVEAHGGTIWAENIRNASIDDGNTILGARFVVALPT